MKTHCIGCPYNIGHPTTEMAYNLGCLPGLYEINESIGLTKAWACHSEPDKVCYGFAQTNKDRVDQELHTELGIHYHG